MSSGDAQVASAALKIPPLQFKQHGPQQGVIGRAGNEGSFGKPLASPGDFVRQLDLNVIACLVGCHQILTFWFLRFVSPPG
jgi:hypothetical protein